MSFDNQTRKAEAERDAAVRMAAEENLLRDAAQQQAANERIAREQAQQDVRFMASGQQDLRDRLYEQQAETRSASGLGWIAAVAAIIAIGSIVWLMGKSGDQQARLDEANGRATVAQSTADRSRYRANEAESNAASATVSAQRAQMDAQKAQSDAQQARLRAEQSELRARQAEQNAAQPPAVIVAPVAVPSNSDTATPAPSTEPTPLEGRIEPAPNSHSNEESNN